MPYKILAREHFFSNQPKQNREMRKKIIWVQKRAKDSLELFENYLRQCRDVCLNVCWKADRVANTLTIANTERDSIDITFREPTGEESKSTLTIKTEKGRVLGSFDTSAREFVRGYLVVHRYFAGECNVYSGVLERDEQVEALEKRIRVLERSSKKRKHPED